VNHEPDLHVEVHPGDGPYLLLVHGMLASRAQWLRNLDALAHIARPVVVELFGHGRSPSPADPAAYRPEAYVRAFERVRVALGAERWFVCGQSLGAALTLRYALDHPERVLAQVFTNSNSALADAAWSSSVRSAMETTARALEADGRAALEAFPVHPRRAKRLPADVQSALVADAALADPRGIALSGLHTVPDSSVRERVRETRVPTLLVVGEREQRFADQRRYAEATIPKLEVVAADAGHAVNAEAWSEFNAAVTAFLARAAAG
jgi:pimeloyl-ACP methyl ester carboxylesterase